MRRTHVRTMLATVAILAIMALPSAWIGSPSAAPSAASTTAPSPATFAAPAVVVPATPHPAILCPIPPFPVWTEIGNFNPVYPIVPNQIPQVPCGKISIDEVHATFSSPTAGSGERWTMPIHVPVDGATYQENMYPQFYVGMVVSGDTLAEWRQALAEVVFQPQGGPVTTYTASVHVVALQNASHQGGSCGGSQMTIAWNDSFYCVLDDVASDISSVSIPAGDWINVTFAGNKSQSSGLDVWVNDTSSPADDLATVLDATTTGTDTFEPFYNAACTDTCTLQWSVNSGTGLGVGFTMCPFSAAVGQACNSYNDTRYNGTHPVEFGIPHFWTGSTYNGDYRYFSPQSTSGVCNGAAASGTLAFCNNEDVAGGDGYYPSFSYNGTELDYGVTRTWTTQDWGGTVFELLSTGAPNDLTPFYFYTIANDSRAGFVGPGGAINVTTHLQDLGNVGYAGVSYRVNGGGPTLIGMTRKSGTLNDGNWTAEIPSGPNGWVNYTINATNNASAQIASPSGSTTYHIQRGPLPTFSIQIATSLGTCGGVELGGTLYADGAVVLLQPGTYPILGVGCYPWVFSSWTLSPGITVAPKGAFNGFVTISAAGTIRETWKYVRPLDTITLFTNPVLCGQILLNGTPYSPPGTGSPVQILNDTNYSLGETGCGSYSFSGWTASSNLTILGTNLLLSGNGTLTASYLPSSSSFTIIFSTNPTTCGGILFQGAGYTNGESLAAVAGTYAIAPDPCYHWGFLSWGTSGSSLTIANGELTVTGSGTITETNHVLTIVTFVTSPSFCGTITFDGVSYTNGQWVAVANNSTHSVFATPCTGYYLFSITGTPGITVTGNLATVNDSGDIIATFLSGSPTNFVGFLTDPPTCGAIYLAGIRYTSSNYTYVATGSQATVTAQACSSYGFLEWITFGGITILNSTAYINGPGAIEAVFRPLASLFLYTSPVGCGTINIANVSYPSNSTLELTEDKAYSLSTTPCTGETFSQWVNSSGAVIHGATLTLTSGSVLTANFVPIRFSVTITVTPPACGGVRVSGQDVANGTVLTLARSTFSIYPAPCTGDHLVDWSLSPGLAIVATTLWVNASGTIGALYQPVPPAVTIYVSGSSFAGIAVPFGATVAVPVPPYVYNYTWDFGDGAPLTTPVNFTSHTYNQPGRYLVTVTVTDPYGRTANDSASIQIIPPSSTNPTGLTTLALLAIGLAVVAVLAVVVIGSRLRRPPPEPSPSLMPPTPTEPGDAMLSPTDDAALEGPKP